MRGRDVRVRAVADDLTGEKHGKETEEGEETEEGQEDQEKIFEGDDMSKQIDMLFAELAMIHQALFSDDELERAALPSCTNNAMPSKADMTGENNGCIVYD